MHSDWHQYGILAAADENMARENLQLHSLGLTQMDEYGVPILDERGELIDNYEQKNIYSNAKIWTGMTASIRRANNEEQGKKLSCYQYDFVYAPRAIGHLNLISSRINFFALLIPRLVSFKQS